MNPVGKYPLELFRVFLSRDSWRSHILRMLAGSPGARHDTLGTSIVFSWIQVLPEKKGPNPMFFSRKLQFNPTGPQTRCARLGPTGTLPSGPAWAERPRWSELDRGAKVRLTPWVWRGQLGGKCFQDCGWGLWEWDISGAWGHLRPDVMDDVREAPPP